MTDTPFWVNYAELAGDYKDRDEWLELRRTGIGSSDCSAVLGMGKYGSPFSVWVEKTGRARPEDETEAMMWGTLLEPVIREELARRLNVEIVECKTLRSLVRPWQLYNPDGLILSLNALVEIKNASAWLASDWEDQVPDHAELQVQHGMAVTGADGAYVAGLVGGNRLRWEYISRDEDLIATINQAEQHLWETYIIPDVAPPIDGSDATAEAIAARWPRQPGVELIAEDPASVADAVSAYRCALAQEKASKVAKAEAVNRLAALLQGADVLTDEVGNKLVALKRGQFREKEFRAEEPDADLWLHKVEVVDRDLLKSENPELYRRFQSTSIYIPKGK
ncbi:YqaJ viral recombinase family nuclease [Mycobacteroides abscessus]|uniref:Putative phage-type endonuclease n=2 Tax=Mycobacteroides abscessus TaxID=36809 RepID=A0A0U0ZN04_9MYCO|nr:YqaJ viral recombinase family protein [Mycobacteroides abscessus]WJJ55952.1 RecE-like exonuclease [Mycobacterium phage prophiT49-1]SKS43645.1 putative phage-type endonuclease [Mycobacteroides abscessus subsp. abscessus]MBL3737082.1 YqaJ viral recombinase family protein [Mycobacteroides abscessus subsp. massiliense]MBL3744227.1 YqaJ viral recombinase family protein [Mycobacteroides abscessus subsp. massiliense]MBL3761363.1 YqaJ viral recombinase family protein [Mycobacteroides abscessus subs